MDPATSVSLNRLLKKLQASIVDPAGNTDPRLRSPYERNRVSANIEYARTLLLTLEKESATIRVQSQRQSIQGDLQSKRETIKQLQARLSAAAQTPIEPEDDSEEDEPAETNGANPYAPARIDTTLGLETGDTQSSRLTATETSELRARRPQNLSAADNHSAASTTAREQLFAGRQQQPHERNDRPELSKHEALMSHHRTEQETLTTGLLQLARALKESSQQFSSSLEQEKDVLKSAEKGLDKSSQGMETAERRMGMLRRMTEGQGWYGRLKMYGLIAALWVGCFLVVFVVPKLR